jgi:hypothetical protein
MEASLRRLRTDHTHNVCDDLQRVMSTYKLAKELGVI